MNKLKKVFKTEKPIIGMVHFMPLLGYKNYLGLNKILKKALEDTKALVEGGVDGIFLENNYDYPHKINVAPETIAGMTYLTEKIIEKVDIPVGLSVLWNDYKTALSIAKVCGGKFIRVPVFVDKVKTVYGVIKGDPADVIVYRKKIEAEDVLLLTDVHVKHAKLLSKKALEVSASEVVRNGSDGIIITGKWTGDAPQVDELRRVREEVKNFPILIGSGASKENVKKLLSFADGVIVGTSLKTGIDQKKNVNIRVYTERIDKRKVQEFVKIVKM